jgi:hypothetical protein
VTNAGHGFVPGDVLVPVGGNRRVKVFAGEGGALFVAPIVPDARFKDAMSLEDWLGVIPNGATRWVAPAAEPATAPATPAAPVPGVPK